MRHYEANSPPVLRIYSAIRVWFIDRPEARISTENYPMMDVVKFHVHERFLGRHIHCGFAASRMLLMDMRDVEMMSMDIAKRMRFDFQEELVRG